MTTMFRNSIAIALIALWVLPLVGCKTPPKGPTPLPGETTGIDYTGQELPPVDPDFMSPGPEMDPNLGSGSGSGTGRNNLEGGLPMPPEDSNGGFIPQPITPIENVEPLDPDGMSALGDDMERWENFAVDREIFAANAVYFGFDLSNIDPSEAPKLDEVGDTLLVNGENSLLIEGHCDERGTEGYNLALGERRALSAREYLINLGISGDRIRTISYGEAMPADEGTTEEAYALNRRAEMVLLTPLE